MKLVSFSNKTKLPSTSELETLKEAVPNAVFFTTIPKLDPEETDTASETEDASELPDLLTCLYSDQYADRCQSDLITEGTNLWSRVKISLEQIKNLEEVTRSQSTNKLWFEHRKGRITASKAHEVYKKKLESNCNNLICKIMGYKEYNLQKHKAVKWGIDNEGNARDKYINVMSTKHENFKCRLSGFMISEKLFIGASADGIASCSCHLPRVVEIKCPFKHKDVSPLTAADIDNEFCLNADGYLKENHKYYTQIQIQMYANKLSCADFVVYTNKDIVINERIPFNEKYIEAVVGMCEKFFFSFLLPEIISRKLEEELSRVNETEENENEELTYCVCDKPEYGRMIQCDNESCEISWFHYPCVNVRRKPKGQWYCPGCQATNGNDPE